MTSKENINDSLQKIWNKKCLRCGSTTDRLNIEGMIHHKAKVECIDRKECKRRTRKNGEVNE